MQKASEFAIYQIDGYSDRTSLAVQIEHEFCIKSVEKYCKKYNIDYFRININHKRYTHSAKIAYHKSITSTDYQQILYLDCDIIVSQDAPNIFSTISCQTITGCPFNDARLAQCKS